MIRLPNTIIEIYSLELRLMNSKSLILDTYKPPSQNERTYVSEIQKLLIYYRSPYDNILLLGDFNMSFSNKNMKKLCDIFELNYLIIDPKFQTPRVLIIFTLTKIPGFIIHLLSRDRHF